ncbi:PPE domain-containing protein [Actinokineospora xionganensis]|uniref:PPE domain-containing protein n=1 Tax=Actinokineospora xionganensis TaxID=2684470 RepID=A0ABR7L6N4_9PSEU|nr:PPE domain-containing protein [Actinokineospora xionganensis]MBC6448069.1 PPE domain-containing protein [Actinokineospora xionganensis]
MAIFDRGYNWDAWSHKDLHKMINGESATWVGGEDGAGVANVGAATDRWNRFTSLMSAARIQTDAALTRAGVAWEGSASESMTAGITPLSQWTVDAGEAGQASGTSVDQFSSSYSSARNRMPEPVEVNSTANSDFGGIPAGFTHLFGGQTDQDKQEAQAQQAKQEAVRVMSGYNSDAVNAQSSVGQFVPPPSVTVAVAPPSTNPGQIDTRESETVVRPSGTDSRERSNPANIHPSTQDATRPTGSTDASLQGAQQTTSSSATPTVQNPQGTGVNPPATGGGQSVAPKPHIGMYPPGHLGGGPGREPTTGRPGTGGPATTGGGRGQAGAGGPGRAGGVGGGAGGGQGGDGRVGGRGPMAGTGALGAADAHQSARGSGAAGGRPNAPMGGGMGAGGKGQGEEDGEHFAADYLHGTNDDFWEDGTITAPPVIGE